MDNSMRNTVNEFLATYNTLVIATESEGQPFATSTFYAEEPLHDTSLILYGTFITTSRKLANLRQNPRVGLFIGTQQPVNWLEAIAHAHIIEDEQTSAAIRQRLGEKSAIAAAFLARVPTVAVELHVKWLRITNLAASPMYTEVTFPADHDEEEQGK